MKPNIKKRMHRLISIRGTSRKRVLLKRPIRRSSSKRAKSLTHVERFWRKQGYQAGRHDALAPDKGNRKYGKKMMNDCWVTWLHSKTNIASISSYAAASNGYVAGYCEAIGKRATNWMLLPTARSVGAIVTVRNAERTISRVLEQLKRLPLHEIIVIVYGTSDHTLERVRSHSHALIVHYPEQIGPHVGRAIGAELSKSDILLFLEGEDVVRAERLIPFVKEIDRGADIALNNRTPYLPQFAEWDTLTVMKHFLNVSFKKPDLHANSLMDVPHALSRNVFEHVSFAALMVPPKAQIQAILAGLQITAPTCFRTLAWSQARRNTNLQLGIGDHVEAFEAAMQEKGERIEFPDMIRKRELIKEE